MCPTSPRWGPRLRSSALCQAAARGLRAAVPPINEMNSRRLIASPEAHEHCLKLAQPKGSWRGFQAPGRPMSALPPKVDIALHRSECPLCAKSGHMHRSKWAYSILIARERESGRARLSHYHRPAAGLRPSSHRKHAVFQSCTPSLSLAGNPHADQRPAERFLAL